MTHRRESRKQEEKNMLLKITDGQALDERKLMDVYAESNLENTDFFCPEEPDKEAAVRMVESGFLDFLKTSSSRSQRPFAGSSRRTACGSAP